MTVSQILNTKGRNVITATPDQTMHAVSRLLAEKRIGAVIVVDQDFEWGALDCALEGLEAPAGEFRQVVDRHRDAEHAVATVNHPGGTGIDVEPHPSGRARPVESTGARLVGRGSPDASFQHRARYRPRQRGRGPGARRALPPERHDLAPGRAFRCAGPRGRVVRAPRSLADRPAGCRRGR